MRISYNIYIARTDMTFTGSRRESICGKEIIICIHKNKLNNIFIKKRSSSPGHRRRFIPQQNTFGLIVRIARAIDSALVVWFYVQYLNRASSHIRIPAHICNRSAASFWKSLSYRATLRITVHCGVYFLSVAHIYYEFISISFKLAFSIQYINGKNICEPILNV